MEEPILEEQPLNMYWQVIMIKPLSMSMVYLYILLLCHIIAYFQSEILTCLVDNFRFD